MDAANIDLKAFTESFYTKITFGKLGAVLNTLEFLAGADVWFETGPRQVHVL
jgi:pyruvate formate lyase activating enzyme